MPWGTPAQVPSTHVAVSPRAWLSGWCRIVGASLASLGDASLSPRTRIHVRASLVSTWIQPVGASGPPFPAPSSSMPALAATLSHLARSIDDSSAQVGLATQLSKAASCPSVNTFHTCCPHARTGVGRRQFPQKRKQCARSLAAVTPSPDQAGQGRGQGCISPGACLRKISQRLPAYRSWASQLGMNWQ